MPKNYRKKPVVVEAIQFTDDNEVISRLSDFIGSSIRIDYAVPDAPVFKVETLEGVMTASVGDYIIKGIQGEFYPCKPDIFEATYAIEPEGAPNDEFVDKLANSLACVVKDSLSESVKE